jgi:hypothetical protein
VPHAIRFCLVLSERRHRREGCEENKCCEYNFFHATYSPCILCS